MFSFLALGKWRFNVRFLKNDFLQLRQSILRELRSFPCSLPYTSHYVCTFPSKISFSTMQLRHEELVTIRNDHWKRTMNLRWFPQWPMSLKLRIGLSVSTKFAMNQRRCYRMSSFFAGHLPAAESFREWEDPHSWLCHGWSQHEKSREWLQFSMTSWEMLTFLVWFGMFRVRWPSFNGTPWHTGTMFFPR